ncbi:sensor histidine kinase [Maricaulis sp.]|uniref:sensor histidine kinase n=1 Tax=Maricaulis sp. TaxID=1486257 RepID=UPI003A94C228
MTTTLPSRIPSALRRLDPFVQLRLWGAGLTLTLTITDSLSVLSGFEFDVKRFDLDYLMFSGLYMLASLTICQLALTPFIAGVSVTRGLLTAAAAVLVNGFSEAFLFWLTISPGVMDSAAGFGRSVLFSLLATGGPRVVLWLAVMLVLIHQLRRQHERDRLRDLEAAVTQAHLSQLESQINPHFLFNALNTLGALINLDRKPEARGAVVALGDLLRRSLKHDADPVTMIADEMESAGVYLQIEALRFPDRLRVEWRVDDRFRHVLVPRFALQTLMENVVKHSVSKTDQLVTATVEATDGPGSTCCISVRNDRYKPPMSAPADTSGPTGLGIANLKRRTEILFPAVGNLICGPADDQHYECKLCIPFTPKVGDSKPGKPV